MKINLVSLVILCVFIAGCVTTNSTSSTETSSVQVKDREKVSLQIGSSTLQVEAVTSSESITKGLGEREAIGSDGMLFFLPDRRVATFWMKGMLIPLDMVWIDGNKVIGVTANVPVHTDSSNLPTYASPSEVTHVLEIPAGDAAKRGIKAGDQVLVTSNK